MRLLLLLLSIGFSLIFYAFLLLSKGESIFGQTLMYDNEISSISGNFVVEISFFIALGLLFLIFFSPINRQKKDNNKSIIIEMIFIVLIFLPVFFGIFSTDKFIILILISFFFGFFSFNFLSNTKIFKKQKIKIREFGLVLGYIINLFSLFYIYYYGFNYYILLVLIYYIYSNYYISKEYKNTISLFFSIISLIVLIYYLFLKIKTILLLFI